MLIIEEMERSSVCCGEDVDEEQRLGCSEVNRKGEGGMSVQTSRLTG